MGKYRTTRFKRIYVEITSSCNLNCSFCQETKREKHFMSVADFSHVLKEIKPYTNFIYLHVKGEPMLHPQFEELLSICEAEGIIVNVTTNGTLLKKQLRALLEHPVHQINVSIHSAEDNDCIDMDSYFKEVFSACEELISKTKTEISMRLWTTREEPGLFGVNNYRVKDQLHINVQSPFEWPDIENEYYNERGFCQGLRTHIAILSNGVVVPCCLDGNGVMQLGNIFSESMEDILNSERAKRVFEGFNGRFAVEQLCRHCSYKERFKK